MGKKAVLKTKQNSASVGDFINGLKNEQQRKDSQVLLDMMEKASGEKPKMWGSAMIGFGVKTYTSPASGRVVDWFRLGFSPRKTNLSLHLVLDIKKYADDLSKLGKHKSGVGCLYINRLDDVDLKVLKKLIDTSAKAK